MINALLAQELAKRHTVTVLTSQPPGLPRQRVENGVRIIGAPVIMRKRRSVASFTSMFAFMLSGIWEGRRLLREETFDVINTHFVLPTGPVGDALARWSGTPNVLTIHGGDLYDPSKQMSPHRHWLLRMWVRHLLRKADTVVAGSRNTLDNMRRIYTPEVAGIRIPLGIRRVPAELPPASRDAYGLATSDVVLVTVGRLVARKAVDQLIQIMAALPPNTHLLLIGSGPEEPKLRSQAQACNVTERVHFLGYVDDEEKHRILKMSDLFVSTSQHEGFGLVFLEAMACGLPVICYDHGGQRDFLIDQQTGYLVRLNDREQFTARCRILIGAPEQRRSMAAFNLQYVEKYFIDHCASAYEKVFQKVIDRRQLAKGNAPWSEFREAS